MIRSTIPCRSARSGKAEWRNPHIPAAPCQCLGSAGIAGYSLVLANCHTTSASTRRLGGRELDTRTSDQQSFYAASSQIRNGFEFNGAMFETRVEEIDRGFRVDRVAEGFEHPLARLARIGAAAVHSKGSPINQRE